MSARSSSMHATMSESTALSHGNGVGVEMPRHGEESFVRGCSTHRRRQDERGSGQGRGAGSPRQLGSSGACVHARVTEDNDVATQARQQNVRRGSAKRDVVHLWLLERPE